MSLSKLKLRDWILLIAVAIGGIALTLSMHEFSWEAEQSDLQERVLTAANRLGVALRINLVRTGDSVKAGGWLFYTQQKVNRQEFKAYADLVFAEGTALRRLRWQPMVREQERDRFERDIRREDDRNFQLLDADGQGANRYQFFRGLNAPHG